jgi:hypothetical protein
MLPIGANVIKLFFVCDFWIFVLSWSVYQTRPEMLTNDKHTSLLQKSVIYEQKSFITMGPGGKNWQLIYNH